jgi:hypothetical protein
VHRRSELLQLLQEVSTVCKTRNQLIYKINSVPARLTATGRLLEYSAFAIFLDTTTLAERTLCRVTTSRMNSQIYRLSKLY